MNKQDYLNRVQNPILFVVYSAQYCSDKSGKEDAWFFCGFIIKNGAMSVSGSGRGDIAEEYGGRGTVGKGRAL